MFSITSLSMNSMQNAACSQLCLQPHPRASEPEHLSTTAGTPTPPSTPTSVCPPLPGRCPGHPGSQRGLDVDYCFDWVLTHLENCIFGSRGRMLWLTALPPRSPLLTSLRPWRFCLQPQQSRIPPPQLWTWRYCREKYQTQAYKVPLVTDPRKGSCWPTPAPRCMSPRPMRSPCGQGQALRLQCRLSAVLSVTTISSFSTRSQQSSTVSTEAASQTQAAA